MTATGRHATFDVQRPDRPLDRVTSARRAFTVIPAAILLATLSGAGFGAGSGNGGLALLTDVYPSTDEQQAVRLELPEPDTALLNRWLPLVKWLLVVPYLVVLAFLYVGTVLAIVASWFAILFSGRYPASLFDFVVGVGRWNIRVVAYAFALATDEYPPFRLTA